jgi:hypothetical protein
VENKLNVWPAIKVALLAVAFPFGAFAFGAFDAGLTTRQPVVLPIETLIFIAILQGAVGIFLCLWVFLGNHFIWPKTKKWGMPTWSGGLMSPWQSLNFFSIILLAMGVGSGISLYVKYGWRESAHSLFLFGTAAGVQIGVRLGIKLFRSRCPASS